MNIDHDKLTSGTKVAWRITKGAGRVVLKVTGFCYRAVIAVACISIIMVISDFQNNVRPLLMESGQKITIDQPVQDKRAVELNKTKKALAGLLGDTQRD